MKCLMRSDEVFLMNSDEVSLMKSDEEIDFVDFYHLGILKYFLRCLYLNVLIVELVAFRLYLGASRADQTFRDRGRVRHHLIQMPFLVLVF